MSLSGALFASILLLGGSLVSSQARADRGSPEDNAPSSRSRRAPRLPRGGVGPRANARGVEDEAQPTGVSARVSAALDRAGVLEAVLGIRSALGADCFPVLCYHNVGRPGPDYPFDPDVIDATPEQLDQHMEVLTEFFQPVGLPEVIAHVVDGAPLPENPVMVTLDDGYRGNLTEVLPILRRHGVPATVFLATEYLNERRIPWWDRVAYLLHHSRVERAELTYPTRLTLDLARDRQGSRRAVLSLIKNVYRLDLDRFLGELSSALEVPWTREQERVFAEQLMLSWDDVRAMARQGVSFGSHTRSHRVLHTLSARELADELTGSREDMRRELGEAPAALAYPAGPSIHRIPQIGRAVEDAGYLVGFTNDTGVNPDGAAVDRWGVRRVGMDRDMSIALFRAMLAVPALCRGREI